MSEAVNVTREAVQAGRLLASQLEDIYQGLIQQGNQLHSAWIDNQQGLGSHARQIQVLINTVRNTAANDLATRKLATKLRLTSRIREDHIESAFPGAAVPAGTAQAVVTAQSRGSSGSLSPRQQTALQTPQGDRTWHQTELTDALRHDEYATQLSFARDETGNLVLVPYHTKGSQRPDAIRIDSQGNFDIREVKDYHNMENLMSNMAQQAADRFELFGAGTKLTFVLAANDFTTQEADMLEDFVEDTLHCRIDWITK